MHSEAEHLLRDASTEGDVIVNRYLDIHYIGQVQEVIVPLRSRTRRVTAVNFARTLRDFHDQHEVLYAFKRPEQATEVVSLRLDLVIQRERVELPSYQFAGREC